MRRVIADCIASGGLFEGLATEAGWTFDAAGALSGPDMDRIAADKAPYDCTRLIILRLAGPPAQIRSDGGKLEEARLGSLQLPARPSLHWRACVSPRTRFHGSNFMDVDAGDPFINGGGSARYPITARGCGSCSHASVKALRDRGPRRNTHCHLETPLHRSCVAQM